MIIRDFLFISFEQEFPTILYIICVAENGWQEDVEVNSFHSLIGGGGGFTCFGVLLLKWTHFNPMKLFNSNLDIRATLVSKKLNRSSEIGI